MTSIKRKLLNTFDIYEYTVNIFMHGVSCFSAAFDKNRMIMWSFLYQNSRIFLYSIIKRMRFSTNLNTWRICCFLLVIEQEAKLIACF